MTTYQQAGKKQIDELNLAMTRYHQRLLKAEVVVDLSVAFAKVDEETGEVKGPALKVRGVPCMAKIKIMSLEDRVQGHGDARITIDGDRWTDLSHDERLAVLDHELTHLIVSEEMIRTSPPKAGETAPPVSAVEFKPKLDDHGRPKLKMRPHDHEHGWFDEVAQRHGKSSLEAQQAQRFVDEFGQYYLWEEPGAARVAQG
jgi:hypothetical protein